MSNFKRIKLTILALQECYPEQKISRGEIINALHLTDFQIKYVE